MTNCEELFSALGIVFPGRVRALLSDGVLEGIAGRFEAGTLQAIGTVIENDCPAHASFGSAGEEAQISCRDVLPWTAERSSFLVRYVDFPHAPGACRMLALTTGPLKAARKLPVPAETLCP
ncbi:hypothetical protein [Altererythrobacter sp. MTPC7]|uniref:hypothetical protein n=1 Tax=Altererythrobacter sp. MTPC7 TaxID=3056567 RepID=UPI0036F20934